MKTITFSSVEKGFILKLLFARQSQYLEEENTPITFVKTIKETINKNNLNWDNYYSKKHKNQITSCINEYLHPFDDKIVFYNELSTIGFTRLSQLQLQEVNLIDQCHTILHKTGYRKSKNRYSDIFEKIEKIKKAEWVGLSRTDARDVYKIGFRIGYETIQWEMSSEVNLLNENFTKGTKKWLTTFPELYGEYVRKQEAVEVITNCTPIGANQDTLELTKYLFN